MKAVYSAEHESHSGGIELNEGRMVPCHEKPERVWFVVDSFRQSGLGDVLDRRDFGLDPILRVHDAGYVEFLRTAYDQWLAAGRDGSALPFVFPGRGMRRDVIPQDIDGRLGGYAIDSGTPIVRGTWDAVYSSAQVALTAAALVNEGQQASLAMCRPPGHHAGRAFYGGYCYLNNAALAAQALIDAGRRRVSVLDVDYHHGNGTQDIFYERSDVQFVSVHADPNQEFPYFLGYADELGAGEGEGFNRNIPLPWGTDWLHYSAAIEQALEEVADFGPEAVVISLGVDTFENDPISKFALKSEHFPSLGRMLSSLRLPTVFVLEGGYAVEEVGRNIVSVLQGFEEE